MSGEVQCIHNHSAHSLIIAGAGGAAHFAGVVASLTPLPVVAVPVSDTRLDGVVASLTPLPVVAVPMPKGVPVATIAINNSTNGALLDIRMLGISDTDLVSRFLFYLFLHTVRVNKKEYNLWVSFGWSGRVSTRKTLEKNMVKREKLEQQGWESNLN
ncbi:unnamed protein product [Eruca vesicaria subsp. sativa]|uniref:phosphoribosylaminoimidazole carboxylase n=1 Tax=Eruca vesicaria subsp. sativa TaxID=29727 RepID=A0ABC8JJS8_ERUVS|nr:unnamed protein product [Eruca vesicaria subsp. sativa]